MSETREIQVGEQATIQVGGIPIGRVEVTDVGHPADRTVGVKMAFADPFLPVLNGQPRILTMSKERWLQVGPQKPLMAVKP